MVYMFYGKGFEEAEAMAPLDCLRRAGITVCTLGIGGFKIESAHGVTMLADRELEGLEKADYEEADMVILPGGMGGVNAIKNSKEACNLINYAAENGKWVAAICAGPTVLGGLGLLKGKKAVCYPGMEAGMTDAEAQIGTPVVVDGKIVTAEAAGSGFAFGLKLVECLKGREAAEKVAFSIHYHGSF